jgi:CelD/BcsL family acetyltransferase involved in cellulose biosynthesis
MYYQLNDGVVYFYLHGLRYENDRKLKPGLVAHTLATQYFIDQGMTMYDYMGGYSQYKEQLADLSEHLVSVLIQRPRSRFKLENMARDFKNRITSESA